MIIIMWSTKSRFNTLGSVDNSLFQAGRQEVEVNDQQALDITHNKIVEVKRHPGDSINSPHAQPTSRSQNFLALRNKHQHAEHYTFGATNDSDEQICSLSPHCQIS